MSWLKEMEFISNVKHWTQPFLDWFNGLPRYQKIITCVIGATLPVATRAIILKLKAKYYNYPPTFIGLPLIGTALWADPQVPKFHGICQQYGGNAGLVMLPAFGNYFVYIYDHELIKKTLKVQLNRTNNFPESIKFPYSFSRENGKIWNKRRSFIHECFTSLINSNYIDNIMSVLLNKSLFPILDKAANDQLNNNNLYYYCRDDVKWLGFSFLFGVLYGVEMEVPQKNDKIYLKFIQLNDEIFAALNQNVMVQQIPIKFIRDLVNKLLDPQKPSDDMSTILLNWYKQHEKVNNNSSLPTFFGKMNQHIDDGQITMKEV